MGALPLSLRRGGHFRELRLSLPGARPKTHITSAHPTPRPKRRAPDYRPGCHSNYHRRAFALAHDDQLVGRHVKGAGHIAKLELALFDELAAYHGQAERLRFQPLLKDRDRPGVARPSLQPLPFLAKLLAGLLAGELLNRRKHAPGSGTVVDKPCLMFFQPLREADRLSHIT
jgi:hypothetical protein